MPRKKVTRDTRPATKADMSAVKSDVAAVRKAVAAGSKRLTVVEKDVRVLKVDMKDVKTGLREVNRDVDLWGNQLAMQMQEFRAAMHTEMDMFRQEMNNNFEKLSVRIEQHIDAAVENRKTDLLGITTDEVTLVKAKTEDHEDRITVLEKRAGVR